MLKICYYRGMNRCLCLFLCLVLISLYGTSLAQQDTAQKAISGRANAMGQRGKPYVILVSIDGFRYDYADMHGAVKLNGLASKGVKAKALLPAFPSLTFPNHYAIVTGMYPSHHGLVGNKIYDPQRTSHYTKGNAREVQDAQWYGGTPLWTLAEQQQLLSAIYYWPGSEAPIGGFYPSYYYPYNEVIPMADRIRTVVDWLSLPDDKRPHLIHFYFPEVDHASHRHGPESEQTKRAVQFVDSALYALHHAVAETGLPVNFVVLSDHGMTSVDQDSPVQLPASMDTSKFLAVFNGTIVNIHVKDKKEIKSLYKQLKGQGKYYSAYRREKVPRKYHYGNKDDYFGRIGDVVLFAKAPYYFSDRRPNPGQHGYHVADVPNMKATFMAWGPAFKEGLTVQAFENVHIYPLLAQILGLPYTHPIDGDKKVLKDILKPGFDQ